MNSLIQKLLPLERAIEIALKIGLLKKPLELAVRAYTKAKGVRTQLALAACVAIAAAAAGGAVPPDLAKSSILALLGAAAPAFLEKAARIMDLIARVEEAVRKEADKPRP